MFDKNQTLKVKGIAIMMLVFHHLFYSEQRIQAGGIRFLLMEQKTVIIIATCMRLCVWIFAFLSAYGLTVQYEKLGHNPSADVVSGFVFKRWVSLMRPYWIVYVLTIVLAVLMSKNPLELFGGSWSALLAGVFALSDLIGAKMPVGAWWYMCFAQILLLFIPFLCEMCRKYGVPVLVAAIAILPFMGEGVVSPYGGNYYNYLFVVIMGVLCAQNGWLNRKKEYNNRLIYLLEGLALLITISLCVYTNYRYAGKDPLRLTKLLMGIASVLVCLFVYRHLTWKPVEAVLMLFGKYSGFIFLIHAFGYTYFPRWVFWNGNAVISYLTLFLFGLAGAILCTGISKCEIKIPLK